MEQNTIDIYEKYGNLFRIKINPPIEKLYPVSPTEDRNLPAVRQIAKDKALSIVKKEGCQEIIALPDDVREIVRAVVCSQIEKTEGLYLSPFKTSIINRRRELKVFGDRSVIIHPGCRFRVICIGKELFLCLDYFVDIRSYLRADEIRKLLPGYAFNMNKGFYEEGTEWKPGRIEDVQGEEAIILTEKGSDRIPSSRFLPDIPAANISKILARKGIKAEFDKEIKKLSLLTIENAPLQRFQKIVDIAKGLKKSLFPIKIGDYEIDIDTEPARLMPPEFDVRTDLTEPFSSFDHEDETKRSQHILEGLTRHGSFDKPKKDIKIVILTVEDQLEGMKSLLDKIINGTFRYQGIGKTFGTNLTIMETLITENIGDYVEKCKEFMRRPDFQDADVFFVFIPEEEGKASYDSPYYEVKKFLTKNGVSCQMVDENTLADPKYKDFNLALDIFAKAGYVPWVLDDELPDVDIFIGLSYSSIKRYERIERMMAYVNVFDKYGRWKFYQGDVEAFPYADRHKHYKEIIKSSIDRYKAETPAQEIRNIQIHHTQKLKKNDIRAINDQVQALLPGCQVFFVYINTHLPVRLFDKDNTDGSLKRGTYVVTSQNQFYMSTTGSNIFRQKGMGTPKILAVTVRNPQNPENINLQTTAQHILSLTRLNWASTREFCHEPISTKYASDISYFMTVFMKDPSFAVSERLRNRPWFL